MVSYRLYEWVSAKQVPKNAAAAATFVVLCATVGNQFLPDGAISQWAYYVLLVAFMPFLYIFSNSHRSTDGWIGELSYPMYVSHVFVLLALSPLLERIPAPDAPHCLRGDYAALVGFDAFRVNTDRTLPAGESARTGAGDRQQRKTR